MFWFCCSRSCGHGERKSEREEVYNITKERRVEASLCKSYYSTRSSSVPTNNNCRTGRAPTSKGGSCVLSWQRHAYDKLPNASLSVFEYVDVQWCSLWWGVCSITLAYHCTYTTWQTNNQTGVILSNVVSHMSYHQHHLYQTISCTIFRLHLNRNLHNIVVC